MEEGNVKGGGGGKANQPTATSRAGNSQEEPGQGMLPLSLPPDSEREEISNGCARMSKRKYQAMYIYVQIFQVRNNKIILNKLNLKRDRSLLLTVKTTGFKDLTSYSIYFPPPCLPPKRERQKRERAERSVNSVSQRHREDTQKSVLSIV